MDLEIMLNLDFLCGENSVMYFFLFSVSTELRSL